MDESCFEIQNGKALVHIAGAATIDNAALFHRLILEAVDTHFPIILDLKNTTEFDSSFIQIVRSLCYTLNRGGHPPLKFSPDKLPEVLQELVKLTGLQLHTSCTRVDGIECVCHKLVHPSGHTQEAS